MYEILQISMSILWQTSPLTILHTCALSYDAIPRQPTHPLSWLGHNIDVFIAYISAVSYVRETELCNMKYLLLATCINMWRKNTLDEWTDAR